MSDADFSVAAVRARVAASALALGRSIDLWSLALAVLALAGLLGAAQPAVPLLPQTCLLVSLLAAGVQKILALRVAFDSAIFADWAEHWACAAGDATSAITADLRAFDRALAATGLRGAPDDSLRDLDSRLRGARKLFGRQLTAFVTQFAACLLAVLAMIWPPAG